MPAGSAAFRRQYAEHRRQEDEARWSLWHRLGVDHIHVRTDRSYVEPLLNFFRMRARRFH